jgi:hypothetical protein
MDDDIKARFEDIDKRLTLADKRFDDVKWFFGSVSLLLSVVAVMAGYNYNNERARLDASVKEFKEEVGKLEPPPELEVFGHNGQPVAGQEVMARVSTRENRLFLTYNFILRNVGSGTTGPMWIKVYTSDPIQLVDVSADEPRYKYETVISPRYLDPSELPGKLSSQRWVNVQLGKTPPPGKYPVLMKHYYGKGKVVTSSFTLVVSASEQ